MNRRRWSLALVAIVAAAASAAAWRYTAKDASAADGCDQVVEVLARNLKPDPLVSATESVAKGDLRYLGVYGYSIFYPGIQDQSCIGKTDVGKAIEGTGDFLCSTRHVKLQQQAVEFAKAYNTEITRNRVRLKLATCSK